jgi:beta-galactosidase
MKQWQDAKRFRLIFGDWAEPDLRSFIRRDRNHPSVWAWSYGNEIPEQGNQQGDDTSRRLRAIIREEDPTCATALGLNTAGPGSGIVANIDLIGLECQGEGNKGSGGNFDNWRSRYGDRMIFSTESSSAVSSRDTYLLPPPSGNSATMDADGTGTDPNTHQMASWGLWAVGWGASPDHVFAAQDSHPYVGGEFVWTGWDYLGEPTPFLSSRSSYFGIIDLAGFPKARYWDYQTRWNPDVQMAHIIPHWNWPGRDGQTTPVHVYLSTSCPRRMRPSSLSTGSLSAASPRAILNIVSAGTMSHTRLARSTSSPTRVAKRVGQRYRPYHWRRL